jgi:hypothetical protein
LSLLARLTQPKPTGTLVGDDGGDMGENQSTRGDGGEEEEEDGFVLGVDEEQEEEEDMMMVIGAPALVSKKQDQANSKAGDKAMRLAAKAAEKAAKEREKALARGLKKAGRSEVLDQVDGQREMYAVEKDKSQKSAKASGHAACELTVLIDKDIAGYDLIRQELGRVGVTVCGRLPVSVQRLVVWTRYASLYLSLYLSLSLSLSLCFPLCLSLSLSVLSVLDLFKSLTSIL